MKNPLTLQQNITVIGNDDPVIEARLQLDSAVDYINEISKNIQIWANYDRAPAISLTLSSCLRSMVDRDLIKNENEIKEIIASLYDFTFNRGE